MSRKHITSPEFYKNYYVSQAQRKGGGGPVFSARLFQRGYGEKGGGIGSFFGNLFRKAVPFLTSATKHLGKVALNTGANVLSDAATGKSFKDSVLNRLRESGEELKRDATKKVRSLVNHQVGSGRKRKKSQQENRSTKKSKPSTRAKPTKRKAQSKPARSSKATKPRTFQDIFG